MCECTNCFDPDCWRIKEGRKLDKAIKKILELEGQQKLFKCPYEDQEPEEYRIKCENCIYQDNNRCTYYD